MKKIFIILSVATLGLGIQGCSKLEDFGNTNLNPAATSEPIISALLSNVEAGLGGYAASTRGGIYCQYFSETQYTDVSLYSIPQIDFVENYAGPLMDLQVIKNRNESNNMTQVATILQQYIFWNVTNNWGDVPYSEALKGAEFTNPAYDTQESIYKGIVTNLANAVSAMDGSTISGDLLFGGDVASWKRFANSLRMLVAIQASKADAAWAKDAFTAALSDAGGYIANNAQNAALNYPGGNFKNPWFNLYNGRKDFGESKTMTDLMASLSDSRQEVFGGATQDFSASNALESSDVGMIFGVERSTAEAFTAANTNWARILRGDKRKENSPQVLISAAQVALARAEAANLGWTSENITTVYNQGITLSFEQWGVTIPGNYLASAKVAIGAAGASGNDEKIATQRYIASYPDGAQGWNIWRKSGYPTLTPAPDAVNDSGEIPRRYTYAASEFTSNKASVEAAVARITGGDTQDSRVWWDK